MLSNIKNVKNYARINRFVAAIKGYHRQPTTLQNQGVFSLLILNSLLLLFSAIHPFNPDPTPCLPLDLVATASAIARRETPHASAVRWNSSKGGLHIFILCLHQTSKQEVVHK